MPLKQKSALNRKETGFKGIIWEEYEMKTITGLWKKQDKEGKTFLTGNIELLDLVVFVFPNNRKTKPEEPDYNLVIAKSEPRNQSEQKVQVQDIL